MLKGNIKERMILDRDPKKSLIPLSLMVDDSNGHLDRPTENELLEGESGERRVGNGSKRSLERKFRQFDQFFE